MPRVGYQNVDSDDRLHESFRLHHTQINLESAQFTCGIYHEYISLLKKFYKDQKSSVQTDVESNMFEINKGTKQGDPLSGLLFKTVPQNSLKDDIQWKKTFHDHDCLTNLRFADDVPLFATSKEQLQSMLCELKKSTEKVGLRIHPEETIFSATRAGLARTRKKKCKSMTLKSKS